MASGDRMIPKNSLSHKVFRLINLAKNLIQQRFESIVLGKHLLS